MKPIDRAQEADMSPQVVTPESLHTRRAALLSRLGMTLEEFQALLASNSTLTGEEWEAREELSNIAFLLGEDPFD